MYGYCTECIAHLYCRRAFRCVACVYVITVARRNEMRLLSLAITDWNSCVGRITDEENQNAVMRHKVT